MHPTHHPGSPAPAEPTPADTLRQAALYLQRHGWTQGRYLASHPDATNPFPAACAYGAMAAATWGHATAVPPRVSTEERRTYALAIDAFDGYLTETYGRTDDDLPRCGIDWNDDPDRTAKQVITAMNAAADRYDHTHRYLAAYAAKTVEGGAQ